MPDKQYQRTGSVLQFSPRAKAKLTNMAREDFRSMEDAVSETWSPQAKKKLAKINREYLRALEGDEADEWY